MAVSMRCDFFDAVLPREPLTPLPRRVGNHGGNLRNTRGQHSRLLLKVLSKSTRLPHSTKT
jgi:hypothetical protein